MKKSTLKRHAASPSLADIRTRKLRPQTPPGHLQMTEIVGKTPDGKPIKRSEAISLHRGPDHQPLIRRDSYAYDEHGGYFVLAGRRA
jgi:hypothetical protein